MSLPWGATLPGTRATSGDKSAAGGGGGQADVHQHVILGHRLPSATSCGGGGVTALLLSAVGGHCSPAVGGDHSPPTTARPLSPSREHCGTIPSETAMEDGQFK